MTRLYIAYGSNLCKRQMRMRCPTARPLGKFLLTSARLVFRGVADLEFAPGESTPCGLWAINPDDEIALDMFEGIKGKHYFKTTEVKLNYNNKPQRALVYLMNHDGGVYPPSQAYADTIRRGYKDFNLDEKYLDEAIARAFSEKNVDDQIARRRKRQREGTKHRELVELPISVAMERLKQQQQTEEPQNGD